MAVTEIASLVDVKTYLRVPNPSEASIDDPIFQDLMDAATEAIEREVGHIVAKTITAERHSGGEARLFLRELPVLYIQSVEEGWGWYNWVLADQTVNTQPAFGLWSYSLDRPSQGMVTRRGPGNVAYPFVYGLNNIRVDYVVGRESVNGAAKLAFLELIGFWYRNSQLRTVNQAPTAFNTTNEDFTRSQGVSSINLGVPDAIIEMLKGAGRRRPVIG